MDESLEDKLHQLDLVQIEKVKKLGLRLSAGLKQFDSLTQLVAQVESQSDFQAVGGFVQKENEPPLQEKIEQLKKEQTRALLALKKAVWDTSNALKQDHDKRQILTARHQEHTELEESL